MTTTKSSPSANKAFRPEIEGLRAIAAILVAVFHIWLGRVSGGVDVFFVVSGFLITTGLISQVERTGGVQFALFWSRLVKRLLPAALTVLLVVVVVSVFVLPKSRWKETIEAVAAGAAYVENWLLAYKAVDYLAQHSAVSPVQHFWALSAQGQFYLVWPMLFALGAWVARRAKVSLRTLMAWTIAALFVASLAFSIYLTNRNQPFAYFNTFARVWEFSIGALLAILIAKIRLRRSIRVLMGWVGVLAIVSCGILLKVSTVFPGYAALWPTLAAVFVILAGTTGSAFGVDRLLASRPMVAIGGFSYSLYLWHFPILVFTRTVLEPKPVGIATGVMILAASFVLAMLTHRFIENPARHSKAAKDRPLRSFAVGGAYAIPVIIGLVAWTAYYFHVRQEERTALVFKERIYPGAAALADGLQDVIDRSVYPGPFGVEADREYKRGKGCNLPDAATQPLVCTVHEASLTGLTIAVVGGSHSAQWLPALEDIGKLNEWRVITFTKSNCPFYFGESVGEKPLASCHDWNENVLALLLQIKPDVVFTTSTRPRENGGDFVPLGYVRAWNRLTPAGIKVIALRDNPDLGFDVSACVELHGAQSPQCARARAEMLSAPSPTQAQESRLPGVKFIDLSDYFCDRAMCYPAVGNVMIYRHRNHITATYIHSLAPMLEREIWTALEMPVDQLLTRRANHTPKLTSD